VKRNSSGVISEPHCYVGVCELTHSFLCQEKGNGINYSESFMCHCTNLVSWMITCLGFVHPCLIHKYLSKYSFLVFISALR